MNHDLRLGSPLRPGITTLLAVTLLLSSCSLFKGRGTPPTPPTPMIDVSAIPQATSPKEQTLSDDWQQGPFMQVFVRAYQDSNGDGMGDLRGLMQRLDYLKELGIRGLWLMPITASADHDHGYATTDYRSVESQYGTLADLDALLAAAHQRGIGVIMDYVVNHSAASHPMFVESLKGAGNPFRDWYVWSDPAPQGWDIWGKNPWYHAATKPWEWKGKWETLPVPPAGSRGHYFGTFGAAMPDYNLRNPKVVDYHISSLRFWLNRGVDGFRLDAVPHLIENDAKQWNDQPESRQLAAVLAQEIKSYPNKYVVCEATTQPQAYAATQVCGGAFAFGFGQHVVKAARGDQAALKELAEYFRTAPATMATFVSNHDSFGGARLWDQVEGDTTVYKLAAAGYLLQPGTPFIYYGEEIGQAGLKDVPGLGDDQLLRAPMSWAASNVGPDGFSTAPSFRALSPNVATHNAQAQRVDRDSIFSFYKDLLALRRARPSLSKGSFEASFVNRSLLGFQRAQGQERTLVLINYGTTRADVDVSDLPRRARMAPIFPRRAGASFVAEVTLADARGHARVSVPARSIRVFDVEARAP